MRRSVSKVLFERKLDVEETAKLDGIISTQVEIDFLVSAKKSIAIQAVNRGGRIKDFMEQWAFRWMDLKKRHRSLLPVMIYDSDRQSIDPLSKRIGNDVCKLFCGYQEISRLHDLIDEVQGSSK